MMLPVAFEMRFPSKCAFACMPTRLVCFPDPSWVRDGVYAKLCKTSKAASFAATGSVINLAESKAKVAGA